MNRSLLITTFPKDGSGNSGDLLISESFIDILRFAGFTDDLEFIFREQALSEDILSEYGNRPIFLPGMSVSANFYPKLYRLTSVERAPATLIPFGCTWQHPIGYLEHAELATMQSESRSMLGHIVRTTGPICVRDHMAAGILSRIGIPNITVGDCGWYHLPSIGRPMRRSRIINKIAVTTPHSADLCHQSIELIDQLQSAFVDADISVFLHSRPTIHVERITEHAMAKGVEVIEAAGATNVFESYGDFDLHVGHRLHGHIGFLRQRIPSVLLVEDARSRGFSTSIPVGCFASKRASVGPHILARVQLVLAREEVRPDPLAVERVIAFIKEEISTGFLRYVGIGQFLDAMFKEIFLPEIKKRLIAAGSR